jgi:hypothetical protein
MIPSSTFLRDPRAPSITNLSLSSVSLDMSTTTSLGKRPRQETMVSEDYSAVDDLTALETITPTPTTFYARNAAMAHASRNQQLDLEAVTTPDILLGPGATHLAPGAKVEEDVYLPNATVTLYGCYRNSTNAGCNSTIVGNHSLNSNLNSTNNNGWGWFVDEDHIFY